MSIVPYEIMKPGYIFIYISICYIALYVAHAAYLGKTVYGDGIYYFSWLRSVAVNHDIQFANEFSRLGGTQPSTPAGMIGNKYSIGPALWWTPAYLLIHSVLGGDGYGLPYQLGVGLSSVLLSIFGLILLYRLLPGSTNSRLLTVIALAWSTNLLFYGAIDVVNSHAVSFVTAVIYLSFVLSKDPNWVACGAALGILTMTRTQDFIYILLLLPMVKHIKLPAFTFGFFIAFLPQLIAWSLLYGNPWTNPYILGGETFTLLYPHVVGVLFHPENGLFLWTPTIAVGVIGLWLRRLQYWPFLLVFMAQLYLISTWSTWWQGASYSGRMFVSSIPVVTFGLHYLMTKLINITGFRVALLYIASFGVLNMLSIVYFLLSR